MAGVGEEFTTTGGGGGGGGARRICQKTQENT